MNTYNMSFEEIMLKSEFTLNMVETQLKILIKEYEFKNDYNLVDHFKTRIKSKESIIGKLERRGYALTIDNIEKHIHDKVGVRIICPFISDVKEVVKLIKGSKNFIILDEKDYIANPKNSGYISYHLIVKVPIYLNEQMEYREAEIQIRTMAMDFWATIEHKLKYKNNKKLSIFDSKKLYLYAKIINILDNQMAKINQRQKLQ